MTDINVGQFSEALNDKADRDLQNIRENTKTVDPLYSGIGYFDLPFSGISTIPFQVRVYLVCKSAEAGWSEGEQTEAFGFGDYSSHLIYTYVSNGVAHARLFAGTQSCWVANKSSGVKTNITVDNWYLKFVAN